MKLLCPWAGNTRHVQNQLVVEKYTDKWFKYDHSSAIGADKKADRGEMEHL